MAGIGELTANSFIKPFQNEAVKTFAVYDGSDRLIEFYMAPQTANNGDTCAVTFYTYVGITGRVLQTKEVLGTWLAIWDF